MVRRTYNTYICLVMEVGEEDLYTLITPIYMLNDTP